MLNLATEESAQTPVNEDTNNNPVITANKEPVLLRCRLCHSHTNLEVESPNIYESSWDFEQEKCEQDNAKEKLFIADVCESLWGIKYERHEFLPERICERCLDMLKDFHKQRCGMQQREYELQQDLKKIKSLDAKYRPGLNGNPGVFEFGAGEEGCVIVDVDPDQLCETSDDEFMGSEGEAELEDEEWDDEDEEEAQNDEDVEMPLGMDAAQMALLHTQQTADTSMSSQANSNSNPTPNSFANSVSAHPKSAFLCQYCDLAFTLQPDCQHHEISSHDPALPFSCNYCQLRLSTRPALIAHIKELHDPERPYVCTHCSKGFVRRSDLKKHTIVHTGVRPFSCHVCSKSFSRNTNLTKHLRIHSSVKPFVCQQCPRSFQTPLELMKHTRSHSEVKPYQCGRCSASFTRKDKLLIHQQVHYKRDAEHQQSVRMGLVAPTEQVQLPLHPYVETETAGQQAIYQQLTPQTSKTRRNFRCDVCDRVFQRERDLQRHRALHMDQLFACKLCGQGFNRREQLQRHELEVHGPSYTCSICCISFLHQVDLEAHLKVHELHHSVAKSTQEALNAAVVAVPQTTHSIPEQSAAAVAPPVLTQAPTQTSNIRPSAADLSFYSNLIPTMNLGFYSETRPEERNGI